MKDFDHIFDITKKNAVQMLKDAKLHQYTDYNYKFTIPINNKKYKDPEISITVKLTRYEEYKIFFIFYDTNEVPVEYNCYMSPSEKYFYTILDTARDFCYYILNNWKYE